MKACLRILGLALLAALFALSIWFFRRPPDPLFQGKYASQWCEELLSADYKVQNAAHDGLLALGEPAVPQLRVMLRRRNPPWEPHLARAVAFLPAFDYQIRDSLLARQQAARVAAAMGPSASAAVPELVTALADDKVAPEAARALVKIGPASADALRDALADHRHRSVRERAALLLGERFPASPAVAKALARAARKDDAPSVRKASASALARLTTSADEVETALLELLHDPAPPVRASAAAALGQRANPAPAIQASLRSAIEDRSPEVRLESAKALWKLAENSSEVLPVLTGVLQTEHAWEAAYALADLRTAAAPAIPHLVAALRRERVPRPYRNPPSSAFALGAIGASAVPALIDVLHASEPHIRLAAVLALSTIGQDARPAMTALRPLLKDEDVEVRHATSLTLGNLGDDSAPVVTALAECLTAEDIYMRFAAADLLRKFQPDGNWSASE